MTGSQTLTCPLRFAPARLACAAALAAAMTPTPAIGGGGAGLADWQIQKVAIENPIKSGSSVIISNLYGDVRVRGIRDQSLPVHAVIQKHRDDPVDPHLAFSAGEPTTLDVRYPHDATGTNEFPVRRVDLTVYLPPGSPVTVITRNGLIKVKGVSMPVHARSEEGAITVSAGNTIDARTRHGSIHATLKRKAQHGRSSLVTQTGTITLRFPPRTRASVVATTRGMISTEYSIKVRRDADSHYKRARLQVSHSRGLARLFDFLHRKASIEIKSEVGDIILLRPFPLLKESAVNPD